jgi:hypothetical protein
MDGQCTLLALVTLRIMPLTSHAMIDLLVFYILITLGCIGYFHDNNDYLRNEHHNSASFSLLNQEIATGGCMVGAA